MEAWAPGSGVAVDVEEPWIQVKVRVRVQAFSNAPAIFLAKSFATQFGGRRDIDDIMSQWTIDVLLHCQAVPLVKKKKILLQKRVKRS